MKNRFLEKMPQMVSCKKTAFEKRTRKLETFFTFR